jgi:hypothetical protein
MTESVQKGLDLGRQSCQTVGKDNERKPTEHNSNCKYTSNFDGMPLDNTPSSGSILQND